MAPKNRIKTQSVKKKKSTTKPAKTAATRDAEKTKERKRTGKAAPLRSSIRVIVRGIPYKLRKFENLGARQLPETYYTRKGMTLRQLIRNTPKLFVANATEVEAHRYKKKKTATGKPALHGIMWTNDPYKPGGIRRYHETYIVGLDESGAKTPVHKHRRVLVQCTCENFVYYWEYANASHGCSRLIYCNGQIPVWTNPLMVPALCKHLIALAKIAMEENL